MSYPYAPSQAALANHLASGGCDPAHGLFPAGFRGAASRATDGTVYCCVEGRGQVRIGEQLFEVAPRDILVAPSRQPRSFSATTEMVLFGYSDRPVQEALGVLREETLRASV